MNEAYQPPWFEEIKGILRILSGHHVYESLAQVNQEIVEHIFRTFYWNQVREPKSKGSINDRVVYIRAVITSSGLARLESAFYFMEERLERVRLYGKTYDEVPGAEALVVRVVSSVDKKLEVKQQFLEIF
ncbi:unnamed protein product [Lactuca saligna]|uniref:CBP/p300-type HAT domain-containing protein n=1 Tax=Lactuca saligna TaxID=75948 RepID=A0AA35YTI0_LACSI|nr:unnamed protein product [Lactuca saligna]